MSDGATTSYTRCHAMEILSSLSERMRTNSCLLRSIERLIARPIEKPITNPISWPKLKFFIFKHSEFVASNVKAVDFIGEHRVGSFFLLHILSFLPLFFHCIENSVYNVWLVVCKMDMNEYVFDVLKIVSVLTENCQIGFSTYLRRTITVFNSFTI